MRDLLTHYSTVRSLFPHETLAVVFDIDGTIVDTRYLILQTLISFDRANGTSLFANLTVESIEEHEAEIDRLLDRLGIGGPRRSHVRAFYLDRLWSKDSIRASHIPYQGVMDVIRWFQLQPRTRVVLNTGRDESLRDTTLRAMNELGREFRVSFDDDLLYMNPGGIGERVAARKSEVLELLAARGIRVCAVIDNEPENLEAMAGAPSAADVLFLHANTIFLSARRPLARSSSGTAYDLRPFADAARLPTHVHLVVDVGADTRFLDRVTTSAVEWIGLPVRSDAYGRPVIGDDHATAGRLLSLRDALEHIADANRSVRLDLRHAVDIDQVVSLTPATDLQPSKLWFSGHLHEMSERGIRTLREQSPESIISCHIDFLAPLVLGALEHALEVLAVITKWGVNRWDLDWRAPRARTLIAELEKWGYAVNITGITEPDALLQAALLHPVSVTAHHGCVLG